MVSLETREDLEAFLDQRLARLREVEEQGANVLSAYDLKIAYQGDAELAVRETIRLLENQIRYARKKLAELNKVPRQGTLFR